MLVRNSFKSFKTLSDVFEHMAKPYGMQVGIYLCVSFVNALSMTTAPKIVITRIFDAGDCRSIEFSGVRDILPLKIRLVSSEVTYGVEARYTHTITLPMQSSWRNFIALALFMLPWLQPTPVSYPASHLYKFNQPMYTVTLRTNLLHHWSSFFASLVPYSSGMEGVSPSIPLMIPCYGGSCILIISYSMRISELALISSCDSGNLLFVLYHSLPPFLGEPPV